MFKLKILFLLTISLISSCSWNDSKATNVYCENHFDMTNDFKNWFPEQDDYRNFIKSSYYESFADNKKCHYYIEYKNGTIIDTWGTYTMTTSSFTMTYDNGTTKSPYFVLYASPTIDFHIIDTIEYNQKTYHIVYQARYYYTSKG